MNATPRNSMHTVVLRMLRGYRRTIVRFLAVCGLLAVVAGVSAALVYPLWYFATRSRAAYAIVAALAASAGLSYLFVKRTRMIVGPEGHVLRALGRRIGRFFVGLARIVLAIAALYGVVVAFGAHLYFVAVPAALIYIVVVGYLVYGRSRNAGRA